MANSSSFQENDNSDKPSETSAMCVNVCASMCMRVCGCAYIVVRAKTCVCLLVGMSVCEEEICL